jgi:putative intracellular protease/amidase/nitroreductase
MKWKNFVIVILLFAAKLSMSQELLERNDFSLEYKLDNFKILVITYNKCSYEETVEMADDWEGWGAEVDFAAPEKEIVASQTKMTSKGMVPDGEVKFKVDFLLHQVLPEKYDVIYIVGGDNYKELITIHEEDIKRIINYSYMNNKIVAAYCHSPAVFSIFEFIKGKSVSVEGRYERKLLLDAGAKVVNDIITVDGNIITGRFPYTEAFTYTVAEHLQYPNGIGPYHQIVSAKNKTIDFIDNVANIQIFKDKPIRRDTLNLLLQTGQKSIISENYSYNYTTKYLCIDNKQDIDKVKNILVHQNVDFFRNREDSQVRAKRYMNSLINEASALIFIYIDLDKIDKDEKPSGYMEMKYYSYIGGISQNIMLGAEALGLGGKLIDIKWLQNAREDLDKTFKAPKNLKLVNVLAIGYADFKFVPALTRKTEENTVYNSF